MVDATSLQRSFYATTAAQYDAMQGADAAHTFALPFLISIIDHLGAQSVLDVGAGTGRVCAALQASRPQVKIIGIEPVAELREVGHGKGIPQASLINGDAHQLPFNDNSFDFVCAFGVMHHLSDPKKAALEMMRVARRAIFISDHNDCGRGRKASSAVKRLAKGLGLWNVYKFVITRGTGYRISPDDGLWYPYSIFDTHKVIARQCSGVHFVNTLSSGPNLYGASHVAMCGLKQQNIPHELCVKVGDDDGMK